MFTTAGRARVSMLCSQIGNSDSGLIQIRSPRVWVPRNTRSGSLCGTPTSF